MTKALIFILGVLIGMGLALLGYKCLHGNKYITLNQDYRLGNGGILKKGTKIKYNSSFSEGFEQYTLYLNLPIWRNNETTTTEENFTVIPYWTEPINEGEKESVGCDSIFIFGEPMPKFEGGETDLMKYHAEKIIPIIAASNEETGNLISKLIYSLVISKEGEIVEVNIVSQVDEKLKSKLETELNNMPDWIAGKVNNRKECIKVMVPISCIMWE